MYTSFLKDLSGEENTASDRSTYNMTVVETASTPINQFTFVLLLLMLFYKVRRLQIDHIDAGFDSAGNALAVWSSWPEVSEPL